MAKGRPRNFDLDAALDKAMTVFWEKGYEGTSLPDLTDAMGINRPSLYAAFGNKESLFHKVLDRYRAEPASYVNRALEEPTAERVFSSLLLGAVDLLTDPERPGGCLFVSAVLSCSDLAEPIRLEVASRRIAGEKDIEKRFKKAVAEGDLPPGTSAASLAKFAATVIWGMSVQAASGSTRKELLRVRDLALRCFPGSEK
jgi:AcrR family transcriptional regulator